MVTNCPVTGIVVGEDDFGVKRVKGVETVSGTIKTQVVVNAAGRLSKSLVIGYTNWFTKAGSIGLWVKLGC